MIRTCTFKHPHTHTHTTHLHGVCMCVHDKSAQENLEKAKAPIEFNTKEKHVMNRMTEAVLCLYVGGQLGNKITTGKPRR